jgi:hypothetical protein
MLNEPFSTGLAIRNLLSMDIEGSSLMHRLREIVGFLIFIWQVVCDQSGQVEYCFLCCTPSDHADGSLCLFMALSGQSNCPRVCSLLGQQRTKVGIGTEWLGRD